MCPDD
jgi:hypothetical protein